MRKSLPVVMKEVVLTTPRRSVGSLFLLLGLVLGLGLAITGGMGWLTTETPPVAELYARSLDGSQEVKRMAASEWARQLHSAEERGRQALLADLRPSRSMSHRFAEVLLVESRPETPAPDAVYLSAVATVLGFAPSEDRDLVQGPLLGALEQLNERLPELQVYLVLALARLGPGASTDWALLHKRAASPDSALRKAVAYSLGVLEPNPLSPQAQDTLIALSEDSTADVRWNAAFALARHKNRAGFHIIEELLEKADKTEREGEESVSLHELLVYGEALRAAVFLGDPELVRKVSSIADSHPNLKLRQAAKEMLRK